jgi:hypothetical protein
MSFLDNLESNLKNLENRDEQQSRREHEDRAEARRRALAAAPYVEQLKQGAFTKELLSHATRIGFGMRLKVRPSWIGGTLRLEAGERRLELRPTPEGIEAVLDGKARKLDPCEKAEALAREWLRPA